MNPWRSYDAWEARDRTLLEAAEHRRERLERLLQNDPALTLDAALETLELVYSGRVRYPPHSPDHEDA